MKTTIHFEGAGRKKEVGADSVGSRIWYGEGDERNAALCTKHDTPSREVGELIVICWAAKNEPAEDELHLVGSSKVMIGNLTKNLKSNEKKGYIGVENQDIYRVAVAALRARVAKTTLQAKGGTRELEGTREAKKLVEEATTRRTNIFDKPDLSIDPKFNLTGAQLSSLTQASVY